MKFGPVAVRDAQGAILAHALKLPDGRRIAKGTSLGDGEIATLLDAGVGEVTVARLDPGDIGEDEAAARIAEALAGETVRTAPAATGRVNLHATANGLFFARREIVDAINGVDPGITLATLDTMKEVAAGRMVATVKIIPYAVPQQAVERAVALAQAQPLGVAPYVSRRIGVVATMLPALKASVMDKTLRVLEERLAPSGSRLVGEVRTRHMQDEIAQGMARLLPDSDILLVFGASAISDIDDVIPAAIRQLGGEIVHFGMPVDPGNLLLLGEIGGKPVIGAPGCARSPAENGFDWVLQRLLAGRAVDAAEITSMGVGGLLMEIGTRPQPREPRPKAPLKVSAVVLAAGRSTRMGATNKLTAELDGGPMLGHVLAAATGSGAFETIVVTGHEAQAVSEIAARAGARTAHNPDYAQGLSTSLAAGVRSVSPQADAVVVLLGDMPLLTAEMVDRMIEAAAGSPEGTIVMASHDGKRGNPVLWPRRHFAELTQISGDVGARQLIAEHGASVIAVELGEAAAFDVDTPEALARARQSRQP